MYLKLTFWFCFAIYRQCHVADIDRRPLQLRLTHDGYLTGNMRMFLPALRSMLLDPHTG